MSILHKRKKSLIISIYLLIGLVIVGIMSSINIFGAEVSTYTISNDWGSGATVNVSIQNTGTSSIDGWTVTWTFPGNQQISNMWNAEYTQSGNSVTVKNFSWNSLIPANGTISFGFNLSYTGTNSIPTDISVNGSIPTETTNSVTPIQTTTSTTENPSPSISPSPTITNDPPITSEPPIVSISKPRIIITTDLGADPDDEQSMVRFLACSNEFDVEGLITATGCWKKTQYNTNMLDGLILAYEKVYNNLKIHAAGYPTPAYLKSLSVLGQDEYGMGDVGSGKDSDGSNMIIAAVDKNDSRPVWVAGWGGMNNLAQAIWKVKNTRSSDELKKFISKVRAYDILGQDDSGAWLAKNFPDLFYIRATGVYGWAPSDSWIDSNVQNHGALGAVYPDRKYAAEGDTPSFMHVYPNGLNDPDQIDQGGWGGRFNFTEKAGIRGMSPVTNESQYDTYYMYPNTSEGASAISLWSDGYNNDFAARMDWSTTSNYSSANHHPIAVLNGDASKQVLKISAIPGSKVALSATGSKDPDGNSLNYSWKYYDEPSSYNGFVTIENSSSSSANIVIPSDARGKNIHVILVLRDNGSPNLFAYRRMVINVN